MPIHSTALVDSSADIADDVEVGPYTIIDGPAKIASGCRIASHVHLYGDVSIAEDCSIDAGAVIGAEPQSIDFDPDTPSRVEIGSRNRIREYVTIHRSATENGATRVGNDNFLMTGAHLGHDVEIGSHNVLANNCLLAGHVEMGDYCFLGGGSVYHQFCRIGDYVMVRGLGGVGQDVPPFVIVASVNRVAGLNVIGLRRGGFDREARASIKRAFELVFRRGLNVKQALEEADKQEWDENAARIFDFMRVRSSRGYCIQPLGAGENRT